MAEVGLEPRLLAPESDALPLSHRTPLPILWTPKTGNRELQQNYRFETVSNKLLGGGGLTSFTYTTSPSDSEVVQYIQLVVRFAL